MSHNVQLARAVRHALVVGAITTAAPAFAQQAPASAGTEPAVLESIVVTGSRIQSPNLESSTPVTQVTAADIATQGVTRVEDLVNQLPQAFAAQNATVANGATGTATVDLRGLGSTRTLVLVDGRRMPYGGVTAASAAADLNQIPTQLVERVEVLTGGASAVYGSDAVSGVVNFITKKNFEGVEVTAQYNFYQHNNSYSGPGATQFRDVIAGRAATNPSQFALPDDNVTDGFGREVAVLMGVNTDDGRGNITLYATAFDSDEVLQRDRDFSACSLAANPTTSFGCGGSATSAGGLFTDFGLNTALGTGNSFNFTVAEGGGWRNYNGNTDAYNFGPLNHFLRPERRYNLGASGHYELHEKADVYAQVMYTDYQSVAQIAPSGNFFETSTINCDNPFIPADRLAAINCTPDRVAAGESVVFYVGRRNVEGGPRQQSFNNSSFRSLVGVRGDLNEAWSYDVSAQISKTKANTATLGYFAIDRLRRALDVTLVDGVPTCRSVTDGSDTNCVPWNPFAAGAVQPGSPSLNYLSVTGLQIGDVDQAVYLGTLAGDFGTYGVKSPWSAEGLQMVFGAEYRSDSLENTVDALQEAGLLAGSGGATIGISGSTRVTDLFTEFRLPIAEGVPFADSLSLNGAYRYSEYGNDLDSNTYTIGAEWAPVSDVRFRGSYSRAVRAPNVVELFTAQGLNLFDLDGDPCGAAAPNPNATAAECIATGVPAGLVGSPALDSPAGQYQFQQGGNTDLQPETSDTYTFGVVLQPRFIENFSLTVDWFNIKIEDTISVFGADNTLNACYTNGDADACSRINRSAAGSLWVAGGFVQDLNVNIGSVETSGIDVNVDYRIGIGTAGDLAFNLTGTYLDELVTNPGPGINAYDCAGFFASSCLIPSPEWRHKFRTSWQTPWNVDLALTWRYFGETEGLSGPNVPLPAARIDRDFEAESYFDLSATWAMTEKASLVVGVNNVLDEDPSINASVGTTGNGNTYPQVYDALGRYIFGRVRIGF